jgi:hypothetical protein
MADPLVRTNFKSDQKPRVSLKQLQAKVDRAESAKVRKRSEGQCEVWVSGDDGWSRRCQRAAEHVHHQISGRGKRGIGISTLKAHKLAVCNFCHRDIHGDIGGKRLERIGGDIPLWTDRYRRVK